MAWECLTGRGLTVLLRTGLVLCLLALASCGGQVDKSSVSMASSGPVDQAAAPVSIPDSERFPPPASDTPTHEDLQAMLDSELARLGRDERTTSQAPLGNDNAVFDLKVSYFDLRQGAVLHWTERHLGDYDMNGLVNASDLTPLAQRWKYTVDYRDASEAGVPWWPVGNPRDGGFSGVLDGKPGFNTPADQWRTARIDGDGNGEVNLGDITPIASHWQQNLDSWRVYRRAPGEEEFSLLLPDPGLDYTIARSANFPLEQTGPDRNWAYRMHFADLNISAGSFEYYIAPYDSLSGTEGSPSPVASIEFVNDPELPEPEIPGNKPPVASFMASPRTGDLPLTVNFDATASHDPDGEIVLYLWDWEGDGVVDQSGNNVPVVSHVYTEPGYWKPRLTIWDDLGSSATLYANINLEISEDGWLPPKMTLRVEPKTGKRPLSLLFLPIIDAPNGIGGLLYEWDFDGDGTVDSNATTILNPNPWEKPGLEYVYQESGVFHPVLRITDNKGLSTFAIGDVEVLPNADPVASLAVFPDSGDAELRVSLDAGASYDPDGDELKFSWDYRGTGKFFSTGNRAKEEHRYPTGTYELVLRVQDPHGAYSEVQHTITVGELAQPTAVITVSHPKIPVGRLVSISGRDSLDPNNSIRYWRWDIDGDGEFDPEFEGNSNLQLTFEDPGVRHITLEIETAAGSKSQATYDLDVYVNQRPVAILTASPDSGELPLSVKFDASQSYDPDGGKLVYYWWPDYYRTQDAFRIDRTSMEAEFNNPGKHFWGLYVIDEWGLESDVSLAEVQVNGPGWQLVNINGKSRYESAGGLVEYQGRPVVSLKAAHQAYDDLVLRTAVDPFGLSWNEPVVIDEMDGPGTGCYSSTLEIVNGTPTLVWSTGPEMLCSQPLESSDDLSVWRDPSLIQSNWSNYYSLADMDGRPAVLATFDNIGFSYVRSDDISGLNWSVWQSPPVWESWRAIDLLSVQGHPAYFNVRKLGNASYAVTYFNADDADGSSWQPAVELAIEKHHEPKLAGAVIDGRPAVAYSVREPFEGIRYLIALDESGNSWSEPVFLDSSGADDIYGLWDLVQLAVVDGRPVVMNGIGDMWLAEDPLGETWGEKIDFPRDDFILFTDLTDIGGHPAVLVQAASLHYAIYLP